MPWHMTYINFPWRKNCLRYGNEYDRPLALGPFAVHDKMPPLSVATPFQFAPLPIYSACLMCQAFSLIILSSLFFIGAKIFLGRAEQIQKGPG